MALINKLSAIGNAIREKTGKTDLLTLDQMPQEISSIETSSGEDWYDTFWDAFQQNGNRTNYNNGFYGYHWTKEIFKPKYDIKPTVANAIFSVAPLTNLKELLEEAGVVLDTSKCSDMRSFIQSSKITHLPTISFESVTSQAYMSNAFYKGDELVYIEKLIISSKNIWGGSSFGGCTKLTTIAEIEGEITTSFYIPASPNLDELTVNNIINALVKFEGTGTAPILTFHSTVKGNLTETQIATITTEKGWTLA